MNRQMVHLRGRNNARGRRYATNQGSSTDGPGSRVCDAMPCLVFASMPHATEAKVKRTRAPSTVRPPLTGGPPARAKQGHHVSRLPAEPTAPRAQPASARAGSRLARHASRRAPFPFPLLSPRSSQPDRPLFAGQCNRRIVTSRQRGSWTQRCQLAARPPHPGELVWSWSRSSMRSSPMTRGRYGSRSLARSESSWNPWGFSRAVRFGHPSRHRAVLSRGPLSPHPASLSPHAPQPWAGHPCMGQHGPLEWKGCRFCCFMLAATLRRKTTNHRPGPGVRQGLTPPQQPPSMPPAPPQHHMWRANSTAGCGGQSTAHINCISSALLFLSPAQEFPPAPCLRFKPYVLYQARFLLSFFCLLYTFLSPFPARRPGARSL